MSVRQVDVPEHTRARVEAERRRLQKASAVLTGAVLAAEGGIDAEIVADAVSAARELIDAAVNALDSIRLNRRPIDEHQGD